MILPDDATPKPDGIFGKDKGTLRNGVMVISGPFLNIAFVAARRGKIAKKTRSLRSNLSHWIRVPR
jgi:hypothetical protein